MGIYSSILNEDKLTAKERNNLKDSSFGLPDKRSYPLNNADHVKSAIHLFGHCPENRKKELARNISKAANKYGIEIGPDTQVAKYLHEEVILESTNRKYRCPYCGKPDTRDNLVSHVERKHLDVIPKGYTPARVVFDTVNGKKIGEGCGNCRVCHKPTSWNEKTCKYNVLCDNPKCREELRNRATKNMVKVYGKTMLLDDPEHQQKMLANRHISGTYTFKDGGKITYTGSYEKKALEFFDQVLEVPSSDIMAPGPTLEYEYNGKTLHWITDIYYIPYNLIIEVKDGGDNPNTRDMPIYRGKQYAKEDMITNLGKFNYLRLTNNNFGQLLYIMAEMKADMLDPTSDHTKTNIKINETGGAAAIAGAMPNTTDFDQEPIYLFGYMKKNTYTGEDDEELAISKDLVSDKVLTFENNRLILKDYDYMNTVTSIYRYNKPDKKGYRDKKGILEAMKENANKENSSFSFFYEACTGRPLLSRDQILYDDAFTEINLYDIKRKTENKINSIKYEVMENYKKGLPVLDIKKRDYVSKISNISEGKYTILEDEDGYFLYDTKNRLRSESYKNIYEVNLDLTKYM